MVLCCCWYSRKVSAGSFILGLLSPVDSRRPLETTDDRGWDLPVADQEVYLNRDKFRASTMR